MIASRMLSSACMLMLFFLVLFPMTVHAYVGPGAGFAFIGSFLALFSALLAGIASLLIWPIRYVYRALRRRKMLSHSNIKRMIVVGLDGFDPVHVENSMAAGHLPNFKRLAEEGSYSHLGTTSPAASPGAWRSFITGVDSSRSGMTDQPTSSLLKMIPPARTFQVGNWVLPLGRPSVETSLKYPGFWKVLGDHGIPSHILHMPFTFPPEKIPGNLLLASGVSDVNVASGSYTYYTSNTEEIGRAGPGSDSISGEHKLVAVRDGKINATLTGPANPMRRNHPNMELPFSVEIDVQACEALLKIGEDTYRLKEREFSPWVRLIFKAAPGKKVCGIARFYLTKIAPEFCMYVTPINMDPEKPVLPISSPSYYSTYLSKMFGKFSTLETQADAHAFSEGIIDDAAFLAQVHDRHDAQEKIFFNALDKSSRGLVACLFGSLESIQYVVPGNPDEGHPLKNSDDVKTFKSAVFDLYRRIDGMVGRVMDMMGPDDHLLVVSSPGWHTLREAVINPAREPMAPDNDEAWQGNHDFDPRPGPGLLLSSRRILSQEAAMADLAPTIITAFGAEVPEYMTGQMLEIENPVKLDAEQAPA